MCAPSETPLEITDRALTALFGWAAARAAEEQGTVIVEYYQLIARMQAAITQATRRFEQSGAFKADGALGMVPWLQTNVRLAGNDAAQQVRVARQLAELPRTEEALGRGEIGYGHALAMAVTAEHVGPAAVRKAEDALLKSAEGMDAGRFVTLVKDFEHRIDADAALAEANWAHRRRYLSISGPFNGLARIEGQLMPEAAAIIRSAMQPFMMPSSNDERTAGQRAHDALVEACRRTGTADGVATAPRTQVIITANLDTLAGIPGAPAGELQGGGTIPSETVQRLACDAAITRITGRGELEWEITHASRSIPPSTRRVVVARDRHCVFPGCDRPPAWCQVHHLRFWTQGGPTKLENLGLVCGSHHRKVHEEGWALDRKDGRWRVTPPVMRLTARARSN